MSKLIYCFYVKVFYLNIKKKEKCVFSRREGKRGFNFLGYNLIIRLFGKEYPLVKPEKYIENANVSETLETYFKDVKNIEFVKSSEVDKNE